MAKKNADFLSWEDDIDLDALLGEYTEDENEPDTHAKEKCLDIYICPVCDREYKSVSGFRGHVMKKHDMNLKGKAEFHLLSVFIFTRKCSCFYHHTHKAT